jgi:putative oxidoreductase
MAMVRLMRIMTAGARILLGLAFVVFGLNYFLEFLPKPDNMDPAAGAFVGALIAGKVLGLIKAVEIGAGLALLGNRFVPLALALLAPILVGINLFHIVYAPAGLVLPLALLAFELWLAWSYRNAFAPMLRAIVVPQGHAEPLVSGRPDRLRDAEARVHAG